MRIISTKKNKGTGKKTKQKKWVEFGNDLKNNRKFWCKIIMNQKGKRK